MLVYQRVRLPIFPHFFGARSAAESRKLLRAPTSPSHSVGSGRAGPRVLNQWKPEAAVVFESERSRKWMEMGTMWLRIVTERSGRLNMFIFFLYKHLKFESWNQQVCQTSDRKSALQSQLYPYQMTWAMIEDWDANSNSHLNCNKSIWVCLKIGYIPNYSHLIGIMISKTIGFRGTLFSDTPI